jgi:PleD family two-component response regulator
VHPVCIGELKVCIGAAIGVAIATESTTPDSLLDAADKLMYRAKATRERISVKAA